MVVESNGASESQANKEGGIKTYEILLEMMNGYKVGGITAGSLGVLLGLCSCAMAKRLKGAAAGT